MFRIFNQIIAIFCFIFFIQKTTAQESPKDQDYNPVSFIASPYVLFGTGEDIENVYNVGFGANMGFKINIHDNKAFFQPTVAFEYFGSYYDEVIQNNLIILKYGFQLKYQFEKESGGYLFPVLDINYADLENYLSPRKNYKGENITIADGNGISTGVGIGVSSGRLNFQVTYNYFHPDISLNESVIGDLGDVSSIYNLYEIHETTMDFSNIEFAFGYQFNN